MFTAHTIQWHWQKLKYPTYFYFVYTKISVNHVRVTPEWCWTVRALLEYGHYLSFYATNSRLVLAGISSPFPYEPHASPFSLHWSAKSIWQLSCVLYMARKRAFESPRLLVCRHRERKGPFLTSHSLCFLEKFHLKTVYGSDVTQPESTYSPTKLILAGVKLCKSRGGYVKLGKPVPVPPCRDPLASCRSRRTFGLKIMVIELCGSTKRFFHRSGRFSTRRLR